MAVARINDLRALSPAELQKRLETYEREMLEVGENPKKGRNLRKAIARIKTIMNEEKTEKKKPTPGEKPEKGR
jgi:ribosomal protein L29